MNSQIREFLKDHPGLLAPLVAIYSHRFRRSGCSLRLGRDGNLVLKKGEAAIRLSISDNSFLEQVAAKFEQFSGALAPKDLDGLSVTDYAAPEASGQINVVAAVVERGQTQPEKYGCTLHLDSVRRHIAIRKDTREIRLAFAQYPYLGDAMGEFDYFFSAVCPEQIDGMQVADFSIPKSHRVPGLDIPYMCSGLPESISTNEAYLAEFNLRAGDVVIDAGAYCGMSTVFFGRAVGPSGAVLAVEADPQSFKCLQANVRASGLANTKAVWAALWHTAGTIAFQAEASLGSAVVAAGPRKNQTVDVPSITLTDAAGLLGRPVTHIKMDVEGAEYRIIPESIEFLRSVRPTVIIEIHNAPNSNKIDAERICNIFSDLGYKIDDVPHTAQNQVFPVLRCRPSEVPL